jgi:hypothetical protein
MTEREIKGSGLASFGFSGEAPVWSLPRYEFTNVNRDLTAENLVLTDISNIKNIWLA